LWRSSCPQLHAALKQYREGVALYVEEFWTDAYLDIMDPLAINANPIFVLEDDPALLNRRRDGDAPGGVPPGGLPSLRAGCGNSSTATALSTAICVSPPASTVIVRVAAGTGRV
jgi:hypothetical protein